MFDEWNPAGPPWTAAEHRNADIADLLRGLIWTYAHAHGAKGRPPLPLPRPYTEQRLPEGDEQVGSRVKAVSIDVMRQRLDELARRDAAGERTFVTAGKVT